jgi:hypothetical protein
MTLVPVLLLHSTLNCLMIMILRLLQLINKGRYYLYNLRLISVVLVFPLLDEVLISAQHVAIFTHSLQRLHTLGLM